MWRYGLIRWYGIKLEWICCFGIPLEVKQIPAAELHSWDLV